MTNQNDRFAHPLRNHGGIVGESKHHGTLKSPRACDQGAEATLEWVGRNPRFMRPGAGRPPATTATSMRSRRLPGTPLMSKMVSGIAIIVPIMAARVTLKAVNDELARRGHHARLEQASGYFYFWSEDSADWIDRTVRVARLNSLTLDQWVGEYLWLKKVNAEMMKPRRVKPWINH